MLRELLSKFRKKTEYPNRFLKFYHENRNRLMKERRLTYHQKRKKGICVRCNRKALSKIVFCSYHQECQKGYNHKARSST